jgi:thioesterase domain-containing protein
VFPYLLLARHLQEGVPVYGLSFPADSTVDSVQKLAEKHINAMRQAQPAGPYRLAGHSFGGLVAYEMAVQLNRNGESVEFLGLIDSFRPDPSRDLTDEIPEILGLLLQGDDDLHAHQDDNPEHALEMAQHVGQLLEQCKRMNLLPKHLSLEQVQERLRIYRKCIQAVQQYDAPPLSAPLYLFAVQDSSEQDRGWSPLVRGQLHIEVVDGTHTSMIQMPHVRRLAEAMSVALDQVEERKVFSMSSSQ